MLERLKRYIQNPVFLFILWMAVALVCSLMLIPKETYSNYITFSQAFWHTISSLPLYIYYPEEQRDLFFVWYLFYNTNFSLCSSAQTSWYGALVSGKLWFSLLGN